MVRRFGIAFAIAAAVGSLSAAAVSALEARSAAGRPGARAAAPARSPDVAHDPVLDRILGHHRGSIVVVDLKARRTLATAGGSASLTEAAPLGSVAKIVTAYGALKAGITTSEQLIVCEGRFEGRTCRKAHGRLDVTQALARSCNVHFLKLGAQLGPSRLSGAAKRFGFANSTGTLDAAIGVGAAFRASPAELAKAISIVATDRGDRHLAPIRAGLRLALEGDGTARGLGGPGRSAAGKTGTAIFDPLSDPPRWYGHFVGYAPADAPEIAVAIRIEGRSAAKDAVPVADQVLRAFSPRPEQQARGIRVRLFAAHEIGRVDILGEGDVEVGGVRERLGPGGLVILPGRDRDLTIRPRGGSLLLVRPSLAARRGRPEAIAARRIPGKIDVAVRGRQIRATAILDVELYAGSVATAELGPGLNPRTLAAQAILARTFALANPGRHGDEGADLCDLSHCQVYKGHLESSRIAAEALGETAGLVLTHRGELADGLYHADCGGRRLANEAVFGGSPRPYLRGGPDAACRYRTSRIRAWTVHYTLSQVADALAGLPEVQVGKLSAVRTEAVSGDWRSPGAVRLEGDEGVRVLSAYRFWRAMATRFGWGAFRSVRYAIIPDRHGISIVGAGAGHAVGLCQAGALALGARGEGADAILGHYFPGASVVPMAAVARPPAAFERPLIGALR
jgi:stage II sporulation protein D